MNLCKKWVFIKKYAECIDVQDCIFHNEETHSYIPAPLKNIKNMKKYRKIFHIKAWGPDGWK